GLLDADGQGRFRATGASRMLRRDHPRSLRAEARHALAPWTAIAWGQLEASVRDGVIGFERAAGMPLFEYLAEHPKEAEVFQALQAVQVRRNPGPPAATPPLPDPGAVVEGGGGNGPLPLAPLERTPGLRGVLYDRPEAIGQARAAAERSPAGSRLDLVTGDFFEGVPAGADTYLLSHVLHDWPDADAVRILRGIAGAMLAESELLLIENL